MMKLNSVAVLFSICGFYQTKTSQTVYELRFLDDLHPHHYMQQITTGPELVETVGLHALTFKSADRGAVIHGLKSHLTAKKGWKEEIVEAKQRIIWRRSKTVVSFETDSTYKHLYRSENEKLWPIPKDGCIVQYYKLK